MRLKTLAIGMGLSIAAGSALAAGQHDHHGPPQTGAQIRPDFSTRLPNAPGKSFKTLVVTYAPGGFSPAHRHAPSAFIYARVLEGSIRSQIEGQEARVYKAGESWTELPGDHHLVSQNASETEPAKLLAVFVVDSSDGVLTTFDP